MIAQLNGTVLQIGPTAAVVEVGGIGLLTQCTPGTTAALRLGERTTLATALIVREDALTLYGFGTAEERDTFELLLTATGVGPKLAQATCAVLSPEQLRAAISTENLVALCKVPGIGRKGAQRMVLELKDKVAALGPVASPTPATPAEQRERWREQVSEGLQGLGWSARDAEAACDEVAPMVTQDPDIGVAVLMRSALRSLAR